MTVMRDAPRTAAFAREVIATMERETRSPAARLALAKAAIMGGNYDEAGKNVFRAYVAKAEGR